MHNNFEYDAVFKPSSSWEDRQIRIAEGKLLQPIRQIVVYVGHKKLGSPVFDAFADYADLRHASALWPNSETNSSDPERARGIAETIRQRRNGVGRYKSVFDRMPGLARGLTQAFLTYHDYDEVESALPKAYRREEISRCLHEKKLRQIDQRNANSLSAEVLVRIKDGLIDKKTS